jgi:NitT/TauT family transport system permease protein
VKWAPLAVFALIVLGWHAAVVAFQLPAYLLPGPATVAAEAWTHAGELLRSSAVTGSAALAGFLMSLVSGVLVAFAFAQSRLVARSFWPYAVFLQTVPIVAIAPLVVIWSGPGFRSVVLVTWLVGVFPIITAATAGLTSVERELQELFRVHNASPWQTLWKLRLPHAVPHLMAGAQASGGLSVVGAIAGEVFAGYGSSARGLGYLILLTSGQLKTAYLFAAALACTLLGLVAFGTLTFVGHAIGARWRDAV